MGFLALPRDAARGSEPDTAVGRWAAASECGDRLDPRRRPRGWAGGIVGGVKLRSDCRPGEVDLGLWGRCGSAITGRAVASSAARPEPLVLSHDIAFNRSWRPRLRPRVADLGRRWRLAPRIRPPRVRPDADPRGLAPPRRRMRRTRRPEPLPGCRAARARVLGGRYDLRAAGRDGKTRITDWGEFHRKLLIDPGYGEAVARPTAAQLDGFEAETGFRLPRSYREYIQVFGPGQLLTDWAVAAPGHKRGWFYDLHTMGENMRPERRWIGHHPEEHRDRVRRCVYSPSKYKDAYGWDPAEVTDPDAHRVRRLPHPGGRQSQAHRGVLPGVRGGGDAYILTCPGWSDGDPSLGPRLVFEPYAEPTA